MSAAFYRAAAVDLDRYADDVEDCDSAYVAECRSRLPEVLQGAATAWLTDQLAACSSDLQAAGALLRTAASRARAKAAEIEAAEAAAAAAAAASLETATDGETAIPDLLF